MVEHPALRRVPVLDKLYLDNTFFQPGFNTFPSHEEAVARAVGLVRAHLQHRVAIANDMLGKEALLYDIGRVSDHMGHHVCVCGEHRGRPHVM